MPSFVPVLKASKAARCGLPQYWQDSIGKLRLMAVVEGYAVMRRPGAKPFVVPSSNLLAGRSSLTPDTGPITKVE